MGVLHLLLLGLGLRTWKQLVGTLHLLLLGRGFVIYFRMNFAGGLRSGSPTWKQELGSRLRVVCSVVVVLEFWHDWMTEQVKTGGDWLTASESCLLRQEGLAEGWLYASRRRNAD